MSPGDTYPDSDNTSSDEKDQNGNDRGPSGGYADRIDELEKENRALRDRLETLETKVEDGVPTDSESTEGTESTDVRESSDVTSNGGRDSSIGGTLTRRGTLATLGVLGFLGASQPASAQTDHDHLGETWTGDPGDHGLSIDVGPSTRFGYIGLTEATDGRSVVGRNTASSGGVIGVLGRVESPEGTAIQGQNDATSGLAFGGRFRSFSSGGRGMSCIAEASTGNTIGLLGKSRSISGIGLEGNATAGSGQTIGLRGLADSPSGTGIVGSAPNGTGTGVIAQGGRHGIVSDAGSNDGFGVYGRNFTGGSSGISIGVLGGTDSTSGTGVYGFANSSSGVTDGILGFTGSVDIDAAGVRALGTGSGDAAGLIASGGLDGTVSDAGANTGFGVLGRNLTGGNLSASRGVYGLSDSTAGSGVYGLANASSGSTEGVFGRSDSTRGAGVVGYGAAANGFNEGVAGRSDSPDGVGVNGYASSSSGFTEGVFGISDSIDGEGVQGTATASSGFNEGVSGINNSNRGAGVEGEVFNFTSGVTQGVFGRTFTSGSNSAGVHGVAESSNGFVHGVLGETDSPNGQGVRGVATASTGSSEGVVGTTPSPSSGASGVEGFATASSGSAVGVYGFTFSDSGYGLRSDGDLRVDGDFVATGSKSFAHRISGPDGEKEIVYTAVESDKVHTELTDTASLRNGRAEISLPDHFGEVTSSTEPISVQVTPHGGTAGLKVTERSAERIIVEDLDGAGSYEFTYTVKGIRAGYEDQDILQDRPPMRGATITPPDDGRPSAEPTERRPTSEYDPEPGKIAGKRPARPVKEPEPGRPESAGPPGGHDPDQKKKPERPDEAAKEDE